MRTLESRLNKLEATAPPETPHHAVQIICESEAEGEAKIAAMRAAGEIFPHTRIIKWIARCREPVAHEGLGSG